DRAGQLFFVDAIVARVARFLEMRFATPQIASSAARVARKKNARAATSLLRNGGSSRRFTKSTGYEKSLSPQRRGPREIVATSAWHRAFNAVRRASLARTRASPRERHRAE